MSHHLTRHIAKNTAGLCVTVALGALLWYAISKSWRKVYEVLQLQV